MYVFIVSIICAVMLGWVYLIASEGDIATTALLTFLLFIAIDSGLRAVLNKPSWIVRPLKHREPVTSS